MSLLASGTDWHQVACVRWSQSDPYPRISGFRRAAEVLAAQVKSTSHDQDILIFPYLYCSRQHIELALKQLVVSLGRLSGDAAAWPSQSHTLLPLWEQFVSGLIREGLVRDEAIQWVEPVIRELDGLDPGGDSFRYHIRRDGSPTLPSLGNVSFQTIEDTLARVANLLDAAMAEVSNLLDVKTEIDAPYRDAGI
jgi:hypothetical protein